MRRLTSHHRIKNAIIHPFVFAVFPVLSLYSRNLARGFFGDVAVITMVLLVFAASLWFFLGLLLKNRAKSAIITSVFFFLFFSFGHALEGAATVLESVQLSDAAGFLVEDEAGYFGWLAIWGILFVAAAYLVVRSSSNLHMATRVLNVIALALVVMVAVNLVASGFSTFLMPRIRPRLDQVIARSDSYSLDPVPSLAADSSEEPTPTASADEDSAAADRNQAVAERYIEAWKDDLVVESAGVVASYDIYYIILDMYARGDVLKEVYDFDNSAFLSFLEDKGFYIASESTANYHHTLQSLASSLNLTYLDEIAGQMGLENTNRDPLITMLKDSRVLRFFRNLGYTTVAFAPGLGFTDIKDVDVYLAPEQWHPSEFQNRIMEITPLVILRKTRDDYHRSRILYNFEHLPDATRIDGPVYVFAHILAPHPPYVFGPNGEPVDAKPKHADYEYDEFVETYRNQVAHVNKRVREAIEEILSQSAEPPIIILQGDHGAAYVNSQIEARMPILNAYYFPDQSYDALYESITPVNTFRLVLNQYFGINHPLLEDRSYFVDSYYLYRDVTDELTE